MKDETEKTAPGLRRPGSRASPAWRLRGQSPSAPLDESSSTWAGRTNVARVRRFVCRVVRAMRSGRDAGLRGDRRVTGPQRVTGHRQVTETGEGPALHDSAADRPTTGAGGTGSYTYDLFGRQTAVPAADAPDPGKGALRI